MTVAKRLHVRLSPSAEGQVRSGHPWVYEKSIREQNRPGTEGEVAVVFDHNNRFLAAGLYDPHSPIRLRVLHRGKPQSIDLSFLATRLRDSVSRRNSILEPGTNGARLLHGESDGIPGLVIDRYDTTLVIKVYSSIWKPWLPGLVDVMISILPKPERIVLRLSRNLQELWKNDRPYHEAQMLWGSEPAQPILFKESNILFESDVLRGQKTGFFLDQRENRRRVEKLAVGRRVLNAFSFSGGFSLYAARGGAPEVTDLDISSHALQSAQRNFEHNARDTAIKASRHEMIQADTFEWLAQTQRQFDLIILDPPSMAKRETERSRAIEAYRHLAALGLRRLRPNGILVASSCSAHVSANEFFDSVRQAAIQDKRRMQELETTEHPADHPVTYKEAAYLKCIYLESIP